MLEQTLKTSRRRGARTRPARSAMTSFLIVDAQRVKTRTALSTKAMVQAITLVHQTFATTTADVTDHKEVLQALNKVCPESELLPECADE